MNAKNAFEELKDTNVFFGEAIHIDLVSQIILFPV